VIRYCFNHRRKIHSSTTTLNTIITITTARPLSAKGWPGVREVHAVDIHQIRQHGHRHRQQRQPVQRREQRLATWRAMPRDVAIWS